MDFLKLLNSLEELVVEIALWIILLPRTLFSAIFTPVKLARYFDRSYAIPIEERDDEYLSPVLCWLILGPISLIIMFMLQDQRALALYGGTANERFATATLMMLGPPLGFALASVLLRRESVTKRSLSRQFALQCYFHAPMSLVFVTLMPLAIRFEDTFVGNSLTTVVGLAWIWLLIVEYRVARRDLDAGTATASAALGCIFAVLLFVLVALAIWLAVFLSGRFHQGNLTP